MNENIFEVGDRFVDCSWSACDSWGFYSVYKVRSSSNWYLSRLILRDPIKERIANKLKGFYGRVVSRTS